MTFYTLLGVLLVLLIGCVLSQKDSCKTYGFCDPGPNCENPIDPNTDYPYCYDCCDGGFIPREWMNDGDRDCDNGSDEWLRKSIRGGLQCLEPKQDCTLNNECCSRTCKDGKCLDVFQICIP